MARSRGVSHRYSLTHPKLYYVWRGMRNRCYNKEHPSYHNYGGRGITVCEEWLYNSKRFCEWSILNGYKEGLHLDRIENDKGYSEENCCFVEPCENVAVGRKRMKSNNKSGYNGVDFNLRQNAWRSRIHFEKKRNTHRVVCQY